MKEQRRLAAIVSADVAGYSRLMGRDESGTLAELKALRQEVVDPAIATHGGRIVKTTGDGLLLEFPSVVNAVRCAVEVQTAMADRTAGIAEDRRMVFRVGVNIGDIIVEGDDIFGDGVNVAARLQEIAAPGGICISSRVHEDVRDRLDVAFDDGGTQALKNIARPVQVWRWQPGTAASPTPAPAPTALPLPDKPSIAVLPFQNMSGDPEQEYFADGMVEDITTGLSRFRELFVIARNSSFTYKGKAVDIKQVGRELGVRHVLEGSVRKASGRIRVTAQLIDCDTGGHLWAERYDRDLVDIFAVQEEITRSIVSRIAPAIGASAIARVRRLAPANLNAHELALRAWYEADAAYVSADLAMQERAMASARQAFALDADCVLAWVTVAYLCWQSAFYSPKTRTQEKCQPGLDAAQRAIELDRFEHRAYMFRGMLHLELRRYDDALSDLRHARELNPSDALALQVLAYGELRNGDAQLAKEHGLESLRLNPQDPMHYNTTSFLAHVCFATEEYAEGLKWVAESRRSHPDFRPTIQAAIKLHVGLGQLDRARVEADRIRSPQLVERIRKGVSMLRRPEHREREQHFYRIAFGLSETALAAEAPAALALPDKPSIAVLPFLNMSGDAEQEYFTDGISEDIITELTRFRELFVIARNSSFSYKGKSPNVRDVGRELGVRYVLEGSVRRAGNRIRLTGQLVDTQTGAHIWAERYDRQLDDVFLVQEELTRSIVRAIAPQISETELARVRRRNPASLSAYELAVRANAAALDAWTRSELRQEALRLAEAALAADPASTIALAARATAQHQHALLGTGVDRETAWREGIAATERMLELDHSSSTAYAWKGLLLAYAPTEDRLEDALANARQGHDLNPHDMITLVSLAYVENMAGNPERAIDLTQEALRISPRDPLRPYLRHNLTMACFAAGRYPEAVEHAKRGIAEAPELSPLHAWLAASYVGLGQHDPARSALAAARRAGPKYVELLLSGNLTAHTPDYRARVTTFLRIAAGLEDQSAAEALR